MQLISRCEAAKLLSISARTLDRIISDENRFTKYYIRGSVRLKPRWGTRFHRILNLTIPETEQEIVCRMNKLSANRQKWLANLLHNSPREIHQPLVKSSQTAPIEDIISGPTQDHTSKMSLQFQRKSLVPEAGLEPPRPCGQRILRTLLLCAFYFEFYFLEDRFLEDFRE